MRRWMVIFVMSLLLVCAHGVPTLKEVAVLYNSAVPESKDLAEYYCEMRGISVEQMVGLDMPVVPDISRAEYNEKVLGPLKAEFDKRKWWSRGRSADGVAMAMRNQIRVLVAMKGVPLRVKPEPKPQPAEGEAKPKLKSPMEGHDEASVDSELAMLGVDGLPTDAALQNKFYKSTMSISEANLPFLVLTGRIDAHSFPVCKRMIQDAVEAEKTGLWGMAYVDVANKFPMGDVWLEAVAAECATYGIPTMVDRYNDTLAPGLPLKDVAIYYGWYDWSLSGPFRAGNFRFKRGAVAVHLHSFSAQQLTDAGQNWCAPLLAKGAAATVGNVYEPYLHLTHDLAMMHKNLLEGDCLVEACWKAMPVTSWQGVVLGDPLYRPFKHIAGTGEIVKEDKSYRALRAAIKQWPGASEERIRQLDSASGRLTSGVLAEATGLELWQQKRYAEAAQRFLVAKGYYTGDADKLRMDMWVISMDRERGKKAHAVESLRKAERRYAQLPEVACVKAWLDIMDPPPPPKADPTQQPKAGAKK